MSDTHTRTSPFPVTESAVINDFTRAYETYVPILAANLGRNGCYGDAPRDQVVELIHDFFARRFPVPHGRPVIPTFDRAVGDSFHAYLWTCVHNHVRRELGLEARAAGEPLPLDGDGEPSVAIAEAAERAEWLRKGVRSLLDSIRDEAARLAGEGAADGRAFLDLRWPRGGKPVPEGHVRRTLKHQGWKVTRIDAAKGAAIRMLGRAIERQADVPAAPSTKPEVHAQAASALRRTFQSVLELDGQHLPEAQ